MSTEMSGALPEGGPLELLRELEGQRVTGVLYFEDEAGERSGQIGFFGGEIAVEQEGEEDPVDLFLSLSKGRYRIRPELPPLPISRGDAMHKRGSLAVHVPADLMAYCEHAGLSGRLQLTHDGHRAEAVYRAGELVAITLDGEDGTDLHEVFAWEDGRFEVRVDPEAADRLEEPPAEEFPLEDADVLALAPDAPAPRPRENTKQFLRVVEMALADVVDRSERARSPTRTSPPLPPPPRARPRSGPPPPRRRRPDEQTVKLIYLGGGGPIDVPKSRTRHVRTDVTAEMALTDARPERRARPTESEDMAKKGKKKSKGPRPTKAAPKPEREESTDAVGDPDASALERVSAAAEVEGAPPPPSVLPTEDEALSPFAAPGPVLAWVLAVLVVGFGILWGLATLFPPDA